MKAKINTVFSGGAWYMRKYLHGRTCQVLAKQTTKLADNVFSTSYFVLHPITKKPGYWINTKDCIDVTYEPLPTWDEFLQNNDYGFSKGGNR